MTPQSQYSFNQDPSTLRIFQFLSDQPINTEVINENISLTPGAFVI